MLASLYDKENYKNGVSTSSITTTLITTGTYRIEIAALSRTPYRLAIDCFICNSNPDNVMSYGESYAEKLIMQMTMINTLKNSVLLFPCLFGFSPFSNADTINLDTIFYVSVQQSFFPIRNPKPQSVINQYIQYANQAFANSGLDIRVRVAKIIDVEPSKEQSLNILADMLVPGNDWHFIDTDKKQYGADNAVY